MEEIVPQQDFLEIGTRQPCDLVLFDENGTVKVPAIALAEVFDGGRTLTVTLVL
jgi:hypothetical protein